MASPFISDHLTSWGRVIREPQQVAHPRFRADIPGLIVEAQSRQLTCLAAGLGRSYGDSGLNPHGGVIAMSHLDRIHSFDSASGIIRADAGISLDDLIRIALPQGFFPPVVPGTRFVTLGGAIANDVHGKNHHGMGSFGCHVRRLSLLRTDGTRQELGPDDPTGLFRATIGGLGLTGIIEWAEIVLKPVPGGFFDAEDVPFFTLDEFFQITAESEATYDYTVAWVDCTQQAKSLGRGIFSRAKLARDQSRPLHPQRQRFAIPFEFPSFALNSLTLKAFNSAYFHLKKAKSKAQKVHYGPFLFPLDSIANWNRIYGRSGMYQYQCVVPPAQAPDATRELLRRIARSGEGSFLAVLKTFGSAPAPGLLSFPREGTTLALDFRNRGQQTLALLDSLDAIVREAGGRLYPAKDGRMSADMFVSGYPAYAEFIQHLDPGLSSGFWRRVKP